MKDFQDSEMGQLNPAGAANSPASPAANAKGKPFGGDSGKRTGFFGAQKPPAGHGGGGDKPNFQHGGGHLPASFGAGAQKGHPMKKAGRGR